MLKKQLALSIGLLALSTVFSVFTSTLSANAQTPYFRSSSDIYNWLNERYGGTWNRSPQRIPISTPNTERSPQRIPTPSLNNEPSLQIYAPNNQSGNSEEQQVNEQVNQYRATRGLPPLQLNPQLSQIARQHSEYQASIGNINHNGFDSRANQMSSIIPNYGGAAENVAYNGGYGDPAGQAVQGWINSPGHRRNMEGNYNQTGIGVVERNGRNYFTQVFARGGDPSGDRGYNYNSPTQSSQFENMVPNINNRSWSQPRNYRPNTNNRPNVYWYYR